MRGRQFLTLAAAAEDGASGFYEKLGRTRAGTIPITPQGTFIASVTMRILAAWTALASSASPGGRSREPRRPRRFQSDWNKL